MVSTIGRTLIVAGLDTQLAVGDICTVIRRDGSKLPSEVIGFRDGETIIMPLGELGGIGHGAPVYFDGVYFSVRPSDGWLGRIVNGLGQPIDGLGPLPQGEFTLPVRGTPPPALDRKPVGQRLHTGIRAVDVFTPLCRGQRLGIFAGSGVGKSTLLSMLARNSESRVTVIGLIGERGREVREFVSNLGKHGLSRSIIVAATSDESPLMRRQASYLTLALAEDQRKRGRQVLCMMDSVTRFAMALREIGLAAMEPPTAKGYPPSVFSELPRLLERAGPGTRQQGDITGIYTVLVDGDDHNEPIADAVRGILDGHVILSRSIAERGRFPAVDILKSLSRMLPDCHSDWEYAVYRQARKWIAVYEEREELIKLGAYQPGNDPELDRAIALYPQIDAFLSQQSNDQGEDISTFEQLAKIIDFTQKPPHEDSLGHDNKKPKSPTDQPPIETALAPAPAQVMSNFKSNS
ncbi:flagellum-specific ATP synthase [Iodidimonas muriae]|uniref:Flagellum-specific ATP synthase n=1 Tax=Iodidimonas muriae TaxID=261467 RepID=A0ABQ2LFG3_9PROT|nr:flagellum-specific ATP synthase [Kordiimonadales bacterium JCM 17843]GGO15524.1 flagellum-specific ATP synthase [Iodidimonas muriae]